MSDIEIINAPNTLRKAKIGSGPGKLDKALLAKAEEAIEEFVEKYAGWLQEGAEELEKTRKLLVEGDEPKQALADLYRMSLDLKGQGSTFGYQLISAVGGSLTDFLDSVRENGAGLNKMQLDVVTAHVGAIRAIVSEDLREEGGPTGQALLNGLAQVVAKGHTSK
ncbi:MAG: hypothetical protein CMM52_00895 [Rhodospirillaceae bacterium]|nr:hypothetical protein [Rhodospirillaceae bacterium]|tara:strand:- start:5805 stop:6299 length:495 start_codon:yes stop_codon:yes gene_type:complete